MLKDGSPAISSYISLFKISRSRGLSEHQRRNLLATPGRGPISRLPFEQTEKETEEYESAQESPANSADTRSVALVRLSDESGNEDYRCLADDSLDQQTSQSLISHFRTRGPDSSIAAFRRVSSHILSSTGSGQLIKNYIRLEIWS